MGYNDTFICKVSQDSQNESNIPKSVTLFCFYLSDFQIHGKEQLVLHTYYDV